MGGRALKHTTTRRYELAEFEEIQKEIYPKLEKYFAQMGMPLYYKNKQSFGDIDIVVAIPENFPYKMSDIIEKEFKPNEIFHNGNCWSFDFKELQVDLITVNPIHFESNLMYLSYNDLGNFIGRLAHQFGLKYGQEGLWYNHNFKGSNIARIPVSKDYPKIYKFLGLDFNKWMQGFDELEDVFNFVAESPYFDWKIFQMDSLNRINRERNLKRTSYMTFLEWIDKNAKHREYTFNDADDYRGSIIETFPEADLEYYIREAEYNHCKSLFIKSKFNGKLVSERFNLTGEALGNAIKKFMGEFASEGIDFNQWILENDRNVIFSRFEKSIQGI